MTTIADDIWAILREVAQSHKEFKEEFKISQQEFKNLQKEFIDSQQNSRKEFEETRKNSQKEFDDVRKNSQKELEDIRKIQKETGREIKAVSVSIDRLCNRLSEFVEEAVRPAAIRLFRERGIDVHEVHRNVNTKRNGEGLEIDLLVVNDNDMVVIECKSNLSIDDVNEHLDRLEKVKRLMPRYETCRLSGAVAGMVIADNVADYAIRKGLYVIGQNGDHLELRNESAFVAKHW
jgi:hypothetical protein